MSDKFITHLSIVDYLTLSGGISSLIAIAFALQGNITLAIMFCFIAMLADAYDGLLARKLGITSEFGRYLDSFMDVLAYLIAPALILYLYGLNGIYSLSLIIFILCGCIRLAVFNQIGNLESNGELKYLGLPVFWSTFILAAIYLLGFIVDKQRLMPLASATLIIFSIAMLSNRLFFKIKNPMMINLLVGSGISLFLLLSIFPPKLIANLFYIQVPLIISGVLHMVFVSRDWLSPLKIPIQAKWFGNNKTLRGFVVVPIITMLASIVIYPIDLTNLFQEDTPNLALLGFVTGCGYMLGELPNSYIKRRLGIPAGMSGYHWLFTIMDQLDSALGISIALWLLGATLTTCVLFIILLPITALIVKHLLYLTQLKQTKT